MNWNFTPRKMRALHVLAQKRKISVSYLDFSGFFCLFANYSDSREQCKTPRLFSLTMRCLMQTLWQSFLTTYRYDFIVDLTNRKNLGINNDYSLKSVSGHYKSRADTCFSQVYFVRWAYFLQIHLHQQLQQTPVASVSSQPAVAIAVS